MTRGCIAPLGRPGRQPGGTKLHCFGIILRYALAAGVSEAERELRPNLAPLCRLMKFVDAGWSAHEGKRTSGCGRFACVDVGSAFSDSVGLKMGTSPRWWDEVTDTREPVCVHGRGKEEVAPIQTRDPEFVAGESQSPSRERVAQPSRPL